MLIIIMLGLCTMESNSMGRSHGGLPLWDNQGQAHATCNLHCPRGNNYCRASATKHHQPPPNNAIEGVSHAWNQGCLHTSSAQGLFSGFACSVESKKSRATSLSESHRPSGAA